MATSVITITVRDSWHDGKRQHVAFSLGIAAGDYPAGGIPINWLSQPLIKSDLPPVWVSITGEAGYFYIYDRSAGKIRIWQSAGSAAPLAEMATTTHANVVADSIDGYALFQALR